MVNCMQSHETIMMVGRAETSHCIGIDGISGSAAWLQGLCISGPDSSVCTRQALVPWNNIPHCTLHSSTWLPCVFHSAIVTPLVPSLLHKTLIRSVITAGNYYVQTLTSWHSRNPRRRETILLTQGPTTSI